MLIRLYKPKKKKNEDSYCRVKQRPSLHVSYWMPDVVVTVFFNGDMSLSVVVGADNSGILAPSEQGSVRDVVNLGPKNTGYTPQPNDLVGRLRDSNFVGARRLPEISDGLLIALTRSKYSFTKLMIVFAIGLYLM